MSVVFQITVGAFLLSTAVAADLDEQVGGNALRLPRAVILQPVMKVREEEDDGPFDWLANLFKGMIAPKKIAQPVVPPMLGPIRVPGIHDEVYIKQLDSLSNANSRVVIRVMNPPVAQIPMPMAIPTSYYTYHETPQFLVSPTRQLAMQSTGFVPMASASSTAQWQRPYQMPQQQYSVNYRNNYKNGYNFLPPNHQNPHQYQSNHRPYYQSQYSRDQQNHYGAWDFDNSIGHSSRVPNYSADSLKGINYPVYPPLQKQTGLNHDAEIRNRTVDSDGVYGESYKRKIKYSAEGEAAQTSSPTNPTWDDRFWLRNQKSTVASLVSENSDETEEDNEELSDNGKFSATHMVEIDPPDLKAWLEKDKQKEASTDLGTAASEIIGEDDAVAETGRTKDIEKRNFRPTIVTTENSKIQKISSRKRNEWKPLDIKLNPVYLQVKKSDNSSETSTESSTSRGIVNNTWMHLDAKIPSKSYRRNDDSSKNKNDRVRIVETIRSSVSVKRSKGKRVKSKSKS